MAADPAVAELLRTVLMIGRNLDRQARTLRQIARQLEERLGAHIDVNAQPRQEAPRHDRHEPVAR